VKLADAVARLQAAERALADDFRELSERHAAEHDVHHQAKTLATQCDAHAERLAPIVERYGSGDGGIERRAFSGELLDDLRELYVAAHETLIMWIIAGQGAKAARDKELLQLTQELQPESDLHMKWALTHIKVSAPQALVSS
jgi:hypothetical protein